MRFKTDKINRKGSTVRICNVPFDFDEDGVCDIPRAKVPARVIEVSDQYGLELIDDEGQESNEDQSKDNNVEQFRNDLKALKLAELRAMAEEADLEGYANLKKSELIELIIENLED